ncbi:MAG: sugar-binding domain-containing protein [Thermoguttaceae bacterium]
MSGRILSFVYRYVFVSAGLLMAVTAHAGTNELPRPEHPFPQMVRAEWLTLNGTWEFAETNEEGDSAWLSGRPYPDKIVVPFCRESKLSGLARTGFVKNVWYRRVFQKPVDWKAERIRLHVGACDWKTRVWINGNLVGEHQGGGASFCFDITAALQPGDNTVILHAFDDTRSGLQATGKQAHSEKSEGCVYTRTTGIWQTVWLEGVGATFLRDVRIEPDAKQSRVLLQAEIDGPCDGLVLKAIAKADGHVVGTAETPADWRNNRLVLNLAEKRLWSIKDPFLYDLTFLLLRHGTVVDRVDSYVGLREVTIHGAAILVNGEATFQRLVLDQGFYPDGVWTAPSDDALRKDIKLAQAAGFNGARLHQKVFEPRYLYWADKLGYLVWGEFPNWGLEYKNPSIQLPVINEWIEIVRRDRNHPSIVGWCPFNETPPEAGPLQEAVVQVTRAIDPSRPVIESSGWYHGMADPDVMDAHDYDQNPAKFRAKISQRPKASTPYWVSEYGGIARWNTQGWGYGNTPKDDREFYARYQGLTAALLDSRWVFGYCYTQLTDVEQEQNGLYTYDRKPKFDIERLRKIQSRAAAYETDPPVR